MNQAQNLNPITPQIAANFLTSVISQAIIQPLGNPYTIGISGLIFDIVDVVDAVIEADITDHYVEQNFATQDHIAQKPVIVTLKGYAAEQIAVYQPNIFSPIFAALQGLIPLVGLGPAFNVQDSEFYLSLNTNIQIQQNVVNAVQTVFQLFNQSVTVVSRQQTVYNFLFSLWQSRTLCIVETPWAVYQNMAIQSLRPTQTGETVFISEFLVTFKQIMTISSITGTTNANSLTSQNTGTGSTQPPIPGGTLASINSTPVNQGNDSGTPNTSSGDPISVKNTSQSIYLQQSQPADYSTTPGGSGPQ